MVDRSEFRRVCFRRLPNHSQRMLAQKRRPACEQIEQDRAEAIDVGSRSDSRARSLRLLRRDETRRPKNSEASRQVAIRVHPFRETEVAHHRLASRIQQDISWLQVPMENAFAMSIRDRPRHFGYETNALARLRA